MAELLTNIVQQLAVDLGQAEEFTATGGSATTTINTGWNALDDPPEEERFKGHYIIVKRDVGGAGASPEGKFALISAYNVDTQTLTHATVADAVASGDSILFVSTSMFPFLDMITAVNRGLRDLGMFSFVDRTLTTATQQTEYSLPANVIEITDVRIQTDTDSNDNQYVSIGGWKLIHPTTTLSTAPILYIPQQASGYTIEVHYNGWHPELTSYSDIVNKFIPKPLVVAAAKVALLEGYINRNYGNIDQHWKNMYAEALRQRDIYKMELPPIREKRKRVGLLWSSYVEDTVPDPIS